MGVDDRTIVPFKSVSEFAAEDAKLAELKKSSKLEDKLTALLMEPDVDNQDPTGLWYSFAHPKALAIMKRFNVTDKSG